MRGKTYAVLNSGYLTSVSALFGAQWDLRGVREELRER